MLEIFKTLARSVFGMNHVVDSDNQYLEVVGNGLDAEHPRNARTLDIAGNEVLAGRLTVGAQPEGDNDVATKKYVDDNAGGGSGGGGVFVAHMTTDEISGDATIAESFADAVAAAEQDIPIFLSVEQEDSFYWSYAAEILLTDDPESLSYIMFLSTPIVSGSRVSQQQVMWYTDDSVEYITNIYPEIG